MKLAYRILILLGIFLSSLCFFGMNMQEKVFQMKDKSVTMGKTTLPYLTFLVEEQEINLLHGYSSALDPAHVRENITPITKEQVFSIRIMEMENEVKRVAYEVIGLHDQKTIEEGTINALDQEEDYKTARIRLKENYQTDQEYALCLTLITSESKRIYYYTRIKIMDVCYLSEKIQFVQDFHKATFRKDSKQDIEKYLEPPYDTLQSYANITIHNDYEAVTYGELSPKVLVRQVPSITEIGKDTASISLEFMITAKSDSKKEYYRVKEHYRFMYTESRCYLYDYNRSMESVFDVELTSLQKGEFKLGITEQTNPDVVTNADGTLVAFTRDHSLWSYSVGENTMTRVFSFQQGNTDFIRDTYDNHDIRILKMDDGGNLDFMVYGYMNRGEYEGRVGILLYHYDRVMQQNTELLYIPISTTYDILKEEMGKFCYSNSYDTFYFHLFNTIYSYNLTAKSLKIIAENVDSDAVVFSREEHFIAYQESTEHGKTQVIQLLDLETGQEASIQGEEILHLYGIIGANIIYGTGSLSDSIILNDGTKGYPMSSVYITNKEGSILKHYKKSGYLILDAFAEGNVIRLIRIKKAKDSYLGFETVSDDYILNAATEEKKKVVVKKRITDRMLTEYYLSMELAKPLEEEPKLNETKNQILTEDTTMHLNREDQNTRQYSAYAFGDIITMSEQLGEAIVAADDNSGVVLDQEGKIVWERGVKTLSHSINGISTPSSGGDKSSLSTCIRMLLAYKNTEVTSDYDRTKESVVDYLERELPVTPLKAQNITLDEVLYFVYKDHPVIAIKENGEAVVIIGYDSTTITISDPQRGNVKMGKKEASKLFTDSDTVYITYME